MVNQLPDAGCTLMNVQEKMCELIQISNPDEVLQGYILTALLKLTAAHRGSLAVDAEDLVRKSLGSKSTDLQQRALELQSFKSGPNDLAAKVLPFDASCEDLGDQLMELQSLSFLDIYVEEALRDGATAYVPESERDEFGVTLTPGATDIPSVALRFDAYSTPTVPQAPVDTTPVALDVPAALPKVSVAAIAAPSQPTLRLPTGSRRWGPAQPEVTEPPVIHLDNVKLQYTQPTQTEAVLDFGLGDRSNGSAEPSDRDFLTASLFGEGTSNSSRGRK